MAPGAGPAVQVTEDAVDAIRDALTDPPAGRPARMGQVPSE